MKLSKKIILFMVGLSSFCATNTFAQDSDINIPTCGIYLNVQDYTEGKLSVAFSCNSQAKMQLNDFLASTYIDVIINGKKKRFNKDSIFGYSNSKNEKYRFYKKHDEEFKIVEDKGIVLYTSYVRVSSNNGKTNKLTLAYFFSKTPSSGIVPLTIANLKVAFPGNIKFHDILDIEFGNGEPLSAYSASDKMYKVNYLLNKANQ